MKIEITINYAPKKNDEGFEEWCSDNGLYPLPSARRAWSKEFQAYMTNAIGIAETKSGGRFFIYEEDLSNEI